MGDVVGDGVGAAVGTAVGNGVGDAVAGVGECVMCTQQSVAPSVGVYCPFGHTAQCLELIMPVYLPDGQYLQ